MSQPTERDRQVAVQLLGWDADDAQPFSDDPEAAAVLVERLGRLGVRVEVSHASSSVALYRGLRRPTGASGATAEEALVKAALRWVGERNGLAEKQSSNTDLVHDRITEWHVSYCGVKLI